MTIKTDKNIHELNHRDLNYIELKKSAKGIYSYNIKIHFIDDEEQTLLKLESIDRQLKEKYINI